MDRERRNNLRRAINRCREILEDDINKRLAYFGIHPEGFMNPSKLTHLNQEDFDRRERLEQVIEKEKIGGISQDEATKRYIRHVGFTYLNRFAALRAMEVRGLIKETIIRRDEYGGRSLREMEIAENSPSLSPDEVLIENLLQAFQEVSKEIRVLFDINNEYSLVFPGIRACSDIIKLLTEDITEDDWKQDDIIGWIYQYYNEEARREYRKRRARRNPKPDDIPITSQFYTPYWIVKALVDNTLGRFWMEMHPNSKIKEFCTYLVPLKNDVPKRGVKSVRDLQIIDPACGSGHFLIYAFDVLFHMYREEEPGMLPSEIATLILENNLFGIDIDLRAVQLAALSLYIKAKDFDSSLKIRKINLVCADIRISDGKRRSEFIQQYKDDIGLQEIFDLLFKTLGYTYEIGSLLRVRQPFEQMLNRKGKYIQTKFITFTGQTEFGKKGLIGQTRIPVTPELKTPKDRTIEEMLEDLRKFEREAIETHDMGSLLFAAEAEKSVGLLGILSQKYDIIIMNPPHGSMPSKTKTYAKEHYPRSYYDYYGSFIEQAVDLCESHGLIGALVGRSLLFTKNHQKIREQIFKENALPEIILDLGFKTIEEANARYVALNLRCCSDEELFNPNEWNTTFFQLSQYSWDDKRVAFEKALELYPTSEDIYEIILGEFSELPMSTYAYWAPSVLRQLFQKFPPLDKDTAKKLNELKIAYVKQGLAPVPKACFTRFWWEVPVEQIAITRQETFEGKKWVPFAEEFYLFYFFADVPVVVNWEKDGKEIHNSPNSVVRNKSFYFRSGLSWSANLHRTQLSKLWALQRWPFRILPKGSIFSVDSQAVITEVSKAWPILSICCSRLIFAASRLITSENKQGTAPTASLPISLPPSRSNYDANILSSLSQEAHSILREWATGEEISTLFIRPWLLQVLYGFNPEDMPITKHPFMREFKWSEYPSTESVRNIKGSESTSLRKLAELCIERQKLIEDRLDTIQEEIDDEVYRIYRISDEDRNLVEHGLSLQKRIDLEGKEPKKESSNILTPVTLSKHIERLLSYYVKKAIESDEDGIVSLDEMFPDNLVGKVRESIANDFGKDRIDGIQQEIHQILGKNMKEWLLQDYFNFHIHLYRNKPIFWQLASYRFGKSTNPGVFSCFVYYHKLTRDTIPKIQAHYLAPLRDSIQREKERLQNELDFAKKTNDKKLQIRLSKDHENITSILDELDAFNAALTKVHNSRENKTKLAKNAKWVDRVIAEVRDNGWNPIIDYGVRVNIEPLKEAMVLAKAAVRVK